MGILLTSLWKCISLLFGFDVVPDPVETIKAFSFLCTEPTFWAHIYASFQRLLLALMLASIVAYPLGLYLGLSKRANALGAPFLYLTYPVPKIVFLPVFFLILGLSDLSRIALIATTCAYQILMIVRASAKRLPRSYINSIKFMGANKWDCFKHVYLPSTLPDFLTALRITTGTGLAVLFLAESFATDEGLGFLIMDAWGIGDSLTMFCGILGISLLGILFYIAIALSERILCPWHKKNR